MYMCPARPCCRYVTDAQTSEIGLSGWGGICCSNLILYRTLAAYHESVWGGKWVLAYTRTSTCIGASVGMYISCMLVPKQHLSASQ